MLVFLLLALVCSWLIQDFEYVFIILKHLSDFVKNLFENMELSQEPAMTDTNLTGFNLVGYTHEYNLLSVIIRFNFTPCSITIFRIKYFKAFSINAQSVNFKVARLSHYNNNICPLYLITSLFRPVFFKLRKSDQQVYSIKENSWNMECWILHLVQRRYARIFYTHYYHIC